MKNHFKADTMAHQIWLAWDYYVSSLIDPAIAADGARLARHRGFIVANLLGGLVALAALPVVLIASPPGRLFIVLGLAALVTQAPLALYLSRTGRLGLAHGVQAVIFAAVVFGVAFQTGGVFSPALFCLLVVPAEAALSGNKRVLTFAAFLCMVTAGGLGLLTYIGEPPVGTASPAAVATVAAGTLAYLTLVSARGDRVAEAAIRLTCENEGRYADLARRAPDILAIFQPTGEAEMLTPAAERILAVPPAQLTGTGLIHRLRVSDRPAFLKALSDAQMGRDPGPVELHVRAGPLDDRSHRHILLQMRCRRLDAPTAEDNISDNQIAAVLRESCHSIDAIDDLTAARDAAQAANQAKSRLLASVSHELRTPLNAIIGFSEMLERDLPTTVGHARQREYAGLITSTGRHLQEIVADLLDMHAGDADRITKAASCRVGAIVDQVSAILGPEADRAGVTFAFDLEDGLPGLRAEPRVCRQILLNLMSNAIKFSEPGGTVTVSVRGGGGAVRLTVGDIGIGMEPADVARLGEPYFQVDAARSLERQGTGLGVSVVRDLIDRFGGTLEFFSRPGAGTRAVVTLPAGSADGEAISDTTRDPIDGVKQLRAG